MLNKRNGPQSKPTSSIFPSQAMQLAAAMPAAGAFPWETPLGGSQVFAEVPLAEAEYLFPRALLPRMKADQSHYESGP